MRGRRHAVFTILATVIACCRGWRVDGVKSSICGSTSRRSLFEQSGLTVAGWMTSATAFGQQSTSAHASEVSLLSPTRPSLMNEYYLQTPATKPSAGRFFFPTLTPPFTNRATYRYSLGRNSWAFEQLLVFANVTATIRTNVILLQDGSLWVHSPQWPTGEFCQLLDDLGCPVRHVVLPCNALEHKAPIESFLKKYPDASVWISPGQYGPFGSCGQTLDESSCRMGYRVDGIFSSNKDAPAPPWASEFDMAVLYVDLPENAGPVSEVAFLHKPTKTLVATDAVIYVNPPPTPPLFGSYFDSATVSDPSFWPKTVLQAVFLPLRQEPDGSWPGYKALENRLVRAPILRAFADARAPTAVRDWVKTISNNFLFDRILTSHFASPIAATPRDFAAAFGYLSDSTTMSSSSSSSDDELPPIACRDWELLQSLDNFIAENKLGAPVVFDYQRGCINEY